MDGGKGVCEGADSTVNARVDVGTGGWSAKAVCTVDSLIEEVDGIGV